MSEREDVLSGEGEEGDYHGDGDSWTDDADEVDFGSLNSFVKSTNLAGMSGEVGKQFIIICTCISCLDLLIQFVFSLLTNTCLYVQ